MAGQLNLFGAPSAEAAERPAAGKGRALARSKPATAPPDPSSLAVILREPEKQNPSREGFDSAAVAVGGGKLDESTPASIAQALAAIAELISEPDGWCRGCSARAADGSPTVPGLGTAARLSAYGAFALLRAEGRIDDETAQRLWYWLDARTPDGERFARWHDQPSTTHAEVLELLKKAEARP